MSRKYTIEEVKKYIEENGDGDILFSKEYIDVHAKLEIICHECEQHYFIRYNNFKEGHRCFNCSHREIWKHHRRITETNNLLYLFPDIAKEWDYNNNNSVPEEYAPHSGFIVNWVCSNCGNKYSSSISNRTRFNNGCPNCNVSKGENKIKLFMNNLAIWFIQQYKFEDCKYKRKLPFDFYLPEYNVCIEYQGEQHFRSADFANKGEKWAEKEFKELQKRDKIKLNYCKKNKIKLIIIPYWEFKNIEQILKNELSL